MNMHQRHFYVLVTETFRLKNDISFLMITNMFRFAEQTCSGYAEKRHTLGTSLFFKKTKNVIQFLRV